MRGMRRLLLGLATLVAAASFSLPVHAKNDHAPTAEAPTAQSMTIEQRGKAEQKAEARQPTTTTAAPAKPAKPAAAPEAQCCGRPACYHHLGPATIESRLGDKRYNDRIYANNPSRSYLLQDEDRITIRLPTIPESMRKEGYEVKWVYKRGDTFKLPIGKEISRATLGTRSDIESTGYVALYKEKQRCASYPVRIALRTQPAPALISESQKPQADKSLPNTTLEYILKATMPTLNLPARGIRATAEPGPPRQTPDVTITDAQGTRRYEDLPVSRDATPRIITLPAAGAWRADEPREDMIIVQDAKGYRRIPMRDVEAPSLAVKPPRPPLTSPDILSSFYEQFFRK